MEENEWQDDEVLSDKASQLLFLQPLIEPKEPPMHNVRTRTRPDGFGEYVVQMRFSGGKSLFIGYKIAEPEIACRFADMATLKFRKHIKRVKYNFSEAQAIADTANTEDNGGGLANMLLTRRERLWKLKGITLKEVSQPSPAKQKSNRRTVESRLAALESPIDSRFDLIAALEARITDFELRLVKLELLISMLDEHHIALEAQPHNKWTVTVPPILDPIQPATPIFYPAVNCTDPSPNHIITPPILWKAPQ